MALGWVYVLTNSAMPGLIKIGQSAIDPDNRSNALYTTGVPEPFTVAYKGLYENYAQLERKAHDRLAAQRNRNEREFFRMTPEAAISAIRDLSASGPKYEEVADECFQSLEVPQTELPLKAKSMGQIERERRRAARLSRERFQQI